MADATHTKRFCSWLWLIAFIGVIVPRRLRADWRQEWEAELRAREALLADWDRLDGQHKLDLLRRSVGAFWDALLLQPRRLEGEMFQDLRYGVRLLVKSPAFTLVAVCSLALGIGANTAIFGLINEVLLRPLPVEEPERLVTLSTSSGQSVRVKLPYPDYADYRDQNEVFEGLISYAPAPLSLSNGRLTERIEALLVSGNYFSTLRVQLALGRGFLPEEDRTPDLHPVAVLSYGLWQRRFGADPGVIGRTINLNGHSFAVVGVAPAEFAGTIRGFAPELYVPMMMVAEVTLTAMPAAQRATGPLGSRNYYWLFLLGRLKPGVSQEQAESAMNILGAQIARLYPLPNGEPRPEPKFILEDGSQGHAYLVRDLSLPLKMLMAIVGLVLLIACANVANLLLARAGGRRKEVAIRLAIGAGRGRLIRQLLTESVLLAALGGGAGLLLAGWLRSLLLTFTPPNYALPVATGRGLDSPVLGFTLCLSVLTGILFGLVPALSASRLDLVRGLKEEVAAGRGLRRLSPRNCLVVTQVALSVLVLIGAGLCLRSLQKLQAVDAGFEPAKVLAASFNLGLQGYNEARAQQFYEQLIERVTRLAGVESASLARITPLGDELVVRTTAIEGYEPQPGENMQFYYNVVGPRYFQTMGTPVLRGREFTSQDTAAAPRVVIVNETLARRYWPDGEALGKRLIFGAYRGSPIPLQYLEIVGVVKDSKYLSLTESARRMMFLPLAQNYRAEMALHVRTAQDPPNLAAAIRREAQALDPRLPLYNVKTLEEQKDRSLYTARMVATLLSVFGLIALVLASIGLYGVLAHVVSQRQRELGIRLALGANSGDVFKLIIGEGMVLVLVGLLLGLAGALAATRLLASLLYGIQASDPATYVGVALLIAGVALAANYLPARKAARTDPLAALRRE